MHFGLAGCAGSTVEPSLNSSKSCILLQDPYVSLV